MNSWHYEEKNWSKWGKERLNALIDKAELNGTIGHDGLELELGLTFELTKCDGDSTTHIRKKKLCVIYNYELTVDDDDPDYTFKLNEDLPFKRKVETALLG